MMYFLELVFVFCFNDIYIVLCPSYLFTVNIAVTWIVFELEFIIEQLLRELGVFLGMLFLDGIQAH